MLISELDGDQATKQQPMNRSRPVRVICVTSGKGGVGKTTVTVNLAVALASQSKQVMLMDADLGLANVDVHLGLHPTYNLSHLISGEHSLQNIIIPGPKGIKIVPASSGIKRMAELTPAEHAGVINAFSELDEHLDLLLIDSAAGICDSVITFSRASQEVVVVVCNEPASLTDAYALIKLLSRDYQVNRFHILPNRVSSIQEGRELFNKLMQVTNRFLDVTLNFLWAIPEDPQLRKSVQTRRAVVEAYPASRSAVAFQRVATQVEHWPIPRTAHGYLQFFIERLVNPGCGDEV